MSLLEEIEIRQDHKRMELEKKALELRDEKIRRANEMLAGGEISKELSDKWIARANEEYDKPKGNLLERVGGFVAERVKIAGENIAASQKEQREGESLWDTLGENFRNMKQDDFTLNIPQQENGIDLSMIPENHIDLSKIPQNEINFKQPRERKIKKGSGKKVVIEKHYYRK